LNIIKFFESAINEKVAVVGTKEIPIAKIKTCHKLI
jgi:hypothetical protein